MSEQYSIFNGRYTLDIGSRGKLSVISNVGQGKVLRVYGKSKDSLRYSNMTKSKGGSPQSYRLSDIKDHALEGVELSCISEDDIEVLLNLTKAPDKLSCPLIIEALPFEPDTYNNKQYVEELGDYTRRYKRVDYTRTSNGFLKFSYKVTTYCEDTRTTTNGGTITFTDNSRIVINDISKITEDERIAIKGLL